MLRIAILGATGHIGSSLADQFARNPAIDVMLYARTPEKLLPLVQTLENAGCARPKTFAIDAFGEDDFDIVINCIGAGDPTRLSALGGGIFDVTEEFDQKILTVLRRFPERLYINMSSGAVFGTTFDSGAKQESTVSYQPNQISPQHYYSLAKLVAEARHRAAEQLNIVDIRVFSYISSFLDISGRFFVAELVRAIINKVPFKTNNSEMIRDFIGPADMVRLINAAIVKWQSGSGINLALDAYSRAPTSKSQMLAMAAEKFGVEVVVDEGFSILAPTGAKSSYYSDYKKAAELGYEPEFDSLETLIQAFEALKACNS